MGISRMAELTNWRFSAAFPQFGGEFSNGGGNIPFILNLLPDEPALFRPS